MLSQGDVVDVYSVEIGRKINMPPVHTKSFVGIRNKEATMIVSNPKWRLGPKSSSLNSIFTLISFAIVLVLSVLTDSQPAYALPLHSGNVRAIPAFARKYGLPCSACHTAWPELNNFGQTFRDNGYQLNNDHDSPIYQDPGYFPITFRITPNWHRESTNNQAIDAVPGVPGDPTTGNGFVNGRFTAQGFDLSGFDMWATGTLYKNISFSLLPSSDSNGLFHFENAFVRFDNLKGSRWLNLRVGKFELDNMISEKRFLFLSSNGGSYQSYHFKPVGDQNGFGLGNNQLGMELAGHSVNSYTRYSVSLLSSNDGFSQLQAGRSFDGYATFSQAFQIGKLGLQRFGGYAYVGQRPTIALTSGGNALPGAGYGNKSFYRVGFSAQLNFGKLEVLPFYLHGYESVFLGTNTPANVPLPDGAVAPTWNSGFVETHLHLNPQFVFTNRVEVIRMSRQALPTTPLNTGDIDAYSVGYRWYPIMFSRAGLAFHNEYSIIKTQGAGVGATPFVDPPTAAWSNSLLAGFDIAF
jgi:hypothetical protein